MIEFLKEVVKGEKFELLIDSKIFPIDIVLKAAYNFLDKGYFFFRFDEKSNIILQFTAKEGVTLAPKKIVSEFSDDLLDTLLRHQLETNNKVIREAIVTKALSGPIDTENFVTLDSSQLQSESQNQIDFEKDIEDILKEIENDPHLKIDEEEINKILQEIEQEEQTELKKPSIALNTDSLASVKASFKKSKKNK